jgi:glycerate kinase
MPNQNSLQNKTVLIAPNSFKECSDSVTISGIIYNNLKKNLDYNLIRKPISDGGDGFTEVCKHYFDGEELIYNISTPYNDEPLACKVIYSEELKTVYIESANVLGLKVVPQAKRNPLLLSSNGLGKLLLTLANENYDIKKVIIGVGGTATIDMGLGACSALGVKLFDECGNELDVIPANYSKAKDIDWRECKLPFLVFNVIDVSNPLIGMLGAARKFGSQKGADEPSLEFIEK